MILPLLAAAAAPNFPATVKPLKPPRFTVVLGALMSTNTKLLSLGSNTPTPFAT